MDGIILKGLIIGFSIAAPVGPIGVLCIRRTLASGRAAGFISGLGAATADALYGSVAGFGLTLISSMLIRQVDWLRLIGGAFLIYLGVKTFLAAPQQVRELANTSDIRSNLWSAYASTLFLTLTNPLTILSFSAIFAGLGLGSQAAGVGASQEFVPQMELNLLASPLLLVLSVFIGSAAWWFILSSLASLLRGRFGEAGMRWVNRLSGATIVLFGLVALFSLTTGQ